MSPAIHPAHPCPVCGYLVFSEPPGSYDNCPVCGWEDDLSQLRWPTMAGGANHPSLIEAQRNYAEFGAANPEFPGDVPGGEGFIRESTWRPIDLASDSFDADSSNPTEWPDPETLYYWRDSFWRRDPLIVKER